MAGKNFCEPSTLFHSVCKCVFQRASRLATELRLAFRRELPVSGDLNELDDVAWPNVLVKSDMSARRVRISPLSLSASLLILINWVRFW